MSRGWIVGAVVGFAVLGVVLQSTPRISVTGLPWVTPRLPGLTETVPLQGPWLAEPGMTDGLAGAPLEDGTALAYTQTPPVLIPDEVGYIRVVVEIVGDVATVGFRRNVPNQSSGYVEETWSRATTRSIDGRMVSVFDRSYPSTILSDLLLYRHGHDFPQVPLGRLQTGASGDVDGRYADIIWLRVGSSALPSSSMRAIDAPSSSPVGQYASHVVNLIVPGFGAARVLGGAQAFEFDTVATTFYRYFADTYHSIAVVPHQSPIGPSSTVNVNIKTDITGIGIPSVDEQATYGSAVLRSMQLFGAGFGGDQATIVHLLGHHWGDESGLTAIAGVTASGFDPARHTPLLAGGPTLLGGVLDGTRLVAVSDPAGGETDPPFQVVRSMTPITFHPLQLYRMGFLSPAEVPEVAVFVDQTQFGATTTPSVGTVVGGEQRTVGVSDLMAALGPRRGPVFSLWRQAWVVVSDQLLSATEMDYYNFLAQRASADSGTRSYDGFGSFFEATGGRLRLETTLVPADVARNPAVSETVPVRNPSFGPTDWRGLILDGPVASVMASGATLPLTGHIDPEILPGQYQFLVVRASRYGDPPSEAVTVQAMIRAGRFNAALRLPDQAPGAYRVDAFVFADADAMAIPTSAVTPLFVE